MIYFQDQEIEYLKDLLKNEQNNLKLVNEENVSITLYCKSENCHGWIIIDNKNDAVLFACPVCGTLNCKECNAIHTGMTCKEFERIKNNGNSKDEHYWICSYCTVINNHAGNVCDICDKKNEVECEVECEVELGGPLQYDVLKELDEIDLILNTEVFMCPICEDFQDPGDGVRIHECIHQFCKMCLEQWIVACGSAIVQCPFSDDDYVCDGTLQEREIRALVSNEVYNEYLNRSIREAFGKIKNSFQCRTVNCNYMWIYKEEDENITCRVCQKVNCLRCKVSFFNKYFI